MGAQRAALQLHRFPDGESLVRLDADVTGRTVVIVASLAQPDAKALPLLFAADAARDLGATRVLLAAPYLAYLRQDRRFNTGEAITSRTFAALVSTVFDGIVTVDPHTFNVLKKDYSGLPPVRHITEVLLAALRAGRLRFAAAEGPQLVYTYHDPCYLGRHNLLYDEPRQLLDALPGMKRVEMTKHRDRSFCCSGGGLALFYEPEEETRMGVLRVNMAREAGADVLVTACPFCLINMEDAIKIAGLEGKLQVVDLTELLISRLVV